MTKSIYPNTFLSISCQQYLRKLYDELKTAALKQPATNYPVAHTQGDILAPSVRKLLSVVPLNQKDVFVDLGSSDARMLLQVFFESPAKECMGIEIVPALHQRALQIAKRIEEDLPSLFSAEHKLTLQEGDFLTTDFNSATVIFVNSLCLSQSILRALSEKINNLPHLHTLFTTRPFPHLKYLSFKKAFPIECSWDSARCYLYQ